MSKNMLRVALGIAAGLSLSAVPGYSATAMSLTFKGPGVSPGTISTSGTSITSMSPSYSQLIVSSAPNSADDGTWDISTTLSYNTSTDVLSLTGTVTDCHTTATCGSGNLGNLNLPVTLESIQLSGPLTLNGTPGYTVTGSGSTAQISVGFGTPTSITDLSALLSDLGDANATTTTLTTGVITSAANGSYNTGTGVGTFHPNSATLTLVVATPEPASMALFGSGLLGLGLLVRRRAVRK